MSARSKPEATISPARQAHQNVREFRSPSRAPAIKRTSSARKRWSGIRAIGGADCSRGFGRNAARIHAGHGASGASEVTGNPAAGHHTTYPPLARVSTPSAILPALHRCCRRV